MSVKINLMPVKPGEKTELSYSGSKLFFVSAVILAISAAVFAGLFIWKKIYLEKNLSELKLINTSLSAQISEKKESPFLSASMRAETVESLLNDHLYLSKLYQIIESLTLKNIDYVNFSSKMNKKNNTVDVELSGEAEDFNSAARQIVSFRQSKHVDTLSFSDFKVNKKGKVEFILRLSFKLPAIKFFQADGKN